MTDRQSNLLDMYGVVNTLYTANQAVIDAVVARANAFAAFQANVTAINANIANQSLVVSGVTADKGQARETLDNLSQVIFAIARTWALAMNDLTSAGEFDFSLSEIAKVKDDTVISFVEHRLAIVDSNIAALADYGITPALVAQWQDAISDYAAVVSLPRTAIVSRSTSTAQLGQLFNVTQRLLRDTIDPLMLPFKVSDPALHTQYRKARIIIDRRGPGNGDGGDGNGGGGDGNGGSSDISARIAGQVTSMADGTPIGEAEVKVYPLADGPDGPSIGTTTDADGRYVILIPELPQQEEVVIEAMAQGFLTQQRNLLIGPGQTFDDENLSMMPA